MKLPTSGNATTSGYLREVAPRYRAGTRSPESPFGYPLWLRTTCQRCPCAGPSFVARLIHSAHSLVAGITVAALGYRSSHLRFGNALELVTGERSRTARAGYAIRALSRLSRFSSWPSLRPVTPFDLAPALGWATDCITQPSRDPIPRQSPRASARCRRSPAPETGRTRAREGCAQERQSVARRLLVDWCRVSR